MSLVAVVPHTLGDPTQFTRLVIGELPGFPHKRRLRDRRSLIDLRWEVLALKLWRVSRLKIPYSVTRSRQGNYDLTTLHFNVKVVDGSPSSRYTFPPLSTVEYPE